jgi:hypothetical protein
LQVTEYGDPPRPQPFTPTGVLLHHTAGAATGDAPSLDYLRRGTADLPAPIVQILIARSGMVHLITEGRANHAGTGSELTGQGIPTDQGNQYLWGIEVESTGQAPDWPAVQWDAAHGTARVLLDTMAATPDRVWRHKDYAGPRKVDTRYTLEEHRAAIGGPAPQPPTPEDDMAALIVKDGTGGTWVVAADLSTRTPLGDPNWTVPRLLKTGCYVEAEMDGDTFQVIPDIRQE